VSCWHTGNTDAKDGHVTCERPGPEASENERKAPVYPPPVYSTAMVVLSET
jgi:hypothetical protein